MKTGFCKLILVAGLLFAGKQFGWTQGFVNLNFEAANIAGYSSGAIPATNAFPNWTVSPNYALYNTFSLSGNSISLLDTNSLYLPSPTIQGKFYVLLNSGNYPGTGIPISIGQTGQVPFAAQSITFWGSIGGLQITFNNQPLSFSTLGSTANYSIYGADISAFAGQTGQLLFTLPPYVGYATIDNIRFSSAPVPEPASFALAGLGTLLFSRLRRRN